MAGYLLASMDRTDGSYRTSLIYRMTLQLAHINIKHFVLEARYPSHRPWKFYAEGGKITDQTQHRDSTNELSA